MSKTKKVTFNMLAAGLPKVEKQLLKYGEHEIYVVPVLPIKQMVQFVNEVVEMCVDSDSGTYLPEVMDFAYSCCVLTYYAGFERPKDIEKAYRVIYETDIYHEVRKIVDDGQLLDLWDAIDEKIKYKLQLMTSSAATGVTELLSKMDEVMNDGQEMIDHLQSGDFSNRIDGLSEMLTRLQNPVADSKDEIVQVIGPIEVVEKDNVVQIPRRLE